MHYAVNNSEVSAPVDQWHLNYQSRTADMYVCSGVFRLGS